MAFSDTIGLLRDRCGQYMLTGPTKAYPRVVRLVNRWMIHGVNSAIDVCCTSISVNMDYAAKLRRYDDNCGPSVCKAVDDVEGGRLGYYDDDDKAMELPGLKTPSFLSFFRRPLGHPRCPRPREAQETQEIQEAQGIQEMQTQYPKPQTSSLAHPRSPRPREA